LIKLKTEIPKSVPSTQEFMKSFNDVGKRLAKRVHRSYDDLTSDWRGDYARGDIDAPVIFGEKISQNKERTLVEVKTDSDKYRYVDLGTERHDISPRSPDGVLVFGSQFTPRTSVKSLATKSGGKSGSLIFTAYVKDHPGVKARHFEHPIIIEQTPIVTKELKKALGDNLRVGTEIL